MLVRGQFATHVFALHPQCVLQPPFFKHLIISPPIIGFWAAGAFGSLSCVWCGSGTMYRPRDHCRSELHTHPAHSEMQKGRLCAFIFFWQALFVHGKPIFSAGQLTKNAKKMGPGVEPTLTNICNKAYTTGPLPCTAIVLLRDHVQTERQKLGPGTEIQGTGCLFCRKISPPICWDFFADLGGGGGVGGHVWSPRTKGSGLFFAPTTHHHLLEHCSPLLQTVAHSIQEASAIL